MRFLYFLLAFLLVSQGVSGIAQNSPVIGEIQLIPNLSIDYFDDYQVSVEITEPDGVVVTSVTATVTPWNVQHVTSGGISTETISWNYFADGTSYGDDPIVKGMTQTGTNWHYDHIRPDNIYPEIFYVPSNHAYYTAPLEVTINQDNYPIMHFNNPFEVGQGTGFFIEFYAVPVSLSGPPSVDLQVYLVAKGKTIDFFQSDWMNDPAAALVGTINRNDAFSHEHGPNAYSKHHLVALSINEIVNEQGIIAVGDKKLDITGDFWIVLYAPTHLEKRSWKLKYHTYTPPNGITTPWYFGNENSNWSTSQASANHAPDAHVHFARNTEPDLVDGIKTEVEVTYTYNSGESQVLSATPKFFSFGTIPALPPNASSFVNPPPGLYSGSVDIGWLPVTDPNNNLSSYSIYLYDDKLKADVYTVVEGIGPAITSYSFNTATGGPPDGGYNIRINACDDTALCATFFLYDNYEEGKEFVVANNRKTWTGASSESWNEAGNWNPAVLPVANELVQIPGTVTNVLTIPASINASVKRLHIEVGGQLTVATGGTLTVTEALVNNAGAAGLVVETGGSLLHQSAWPSINVAATVNHTILSGSWPSSEKGGQDGWHLLASPVAEQAISGGFTPTVDGYDFYGWDEGTDKWINQKKTETFSAWNGGSGNLVPGRGYLVSYEQETNLSFSGGLNLQDVTMTGLTLTSHDPTPYYESGWHLLGNPYACGLDWGSTEWTMTNLAATAKIWGVGGYVDVQPDLGTMIPALQGFFVQVTEATGSITIPSAARKHGGSWQKNSDAPHVLLVASAQGSQLRQRSVVRTIPDGGTDYNSRFLAGDAPMLYAIHNGQRFSTRALDHIGEETVVPFGFVKNHEGGEFSIALEASIPGTTPYLIDRKLNREHRLSADNPYLFASNEGDEPQRFELWFTTAGLDPTDVKSPKTEALARIYTDDKLLILEFHEPASGRQLEVFDLSGRRLLNQSIGETATQHQQHLNLNPGIYIVRLSNNQSVQTEKIIITR